MKENYFYMLKRLQNRSMFFFFRKNLDKQYHSKISFDIITISGI